MAQRLRLDDPVGAVPVHLACGIYGTLCVALFGDAELLAHGRIEQLGVQVVGVLACAAWTVPISAAIFLTMKHTVGLRVSPELELDGIQIERRTKGRGADEEEKESLDMDELAEMMGE